mgnify:CR=1 FL=1
MIVKRIRKGAPRKRRSFDEIRTIVNVLSTYVLNASTDRSLMYDGENALAKYVLDTQILAGHPVEVGEKVDLHGTRRLQGSALVGLQRQMLAANLLTPGAVDPIEHYVMSWKSHERPALKEIEDRLQTSLPQVRGIPVVTCSSLTGRGLEKLLPAVVRVHEIWNRRVETGLLNRWLEGMVDSHPPPVVKPPPPPKAQPAKERAPKKKKRAKAASAS